MPVSQSPLSPGAIDLERKIERAQLNPVEHLRRGLDQGEVDFETVQICLSTYRSLRLIDPPRQARVQAIERDQIGALVLSWLWKVPNRWARVLEHDLRFRDDLCYFLAAEQKHDYIVSALKLDDPSASVSPNWRAVLLRATIRALLNTSQWNADRALDVFFQVQTECKPSRAPRSHSQHSEGRGSDF